MLLELEVEPDKAVCVLVCLFAHTQASVLESGKANKFAECRVKCSTNLSTSQINVQIDSTDKEPHHPESKIKSKFVICGRLRRHICHTSSSLIN